MAPAGPGGFFFLGGSLLAAGSDEVEAVEGADGVGGLAACPFMGLGMTPVCIFSSTASLCSWIYSTHTCAHTNWLDAVCQTKTTRCFSPSSPLQLPAHLGQLGLVDVFQVGVERAVSNHPQESSHTFHRCISHCLVRVI